MKNLLSDLFRNGLREHITICGLMTIVICGCSRGPAKPSELANLAPLVGSVSYKGEPPVGAVLTLFPASENDNKLASELPPSLASTATVKEDGSFEFQTAVPKGTAKGAFPGKYVVAVSWTKPLHPDDRDSDLTPELLPKKYQDVKTSGLEIEVKSGKNKLEPIELNP